MAAEQNAINIQDIPAPLQDLAREVSRTRQRRRLPVDGADVTIVVEPTTPRRSSAKARPAKGNEMLLDLIGMGRGEGPSNASEFKYEALEEAHRTQHSS